MLQLFSITKQYRTNALVQTALNEVSLNLRDSEFVSILGPSGSGKTTLLNIIGGLDRYDSGDLIIDGISTKQYNSRAWDSYRNHSIGFVFQSYNLIPHQSVLANVELALTIGGIKKKERRERATEALREVGLEEHMHKRPNQLSGGQMQRVAIARALVNDPKILLADEPTGALDTDTGIQVMEILKKVAENRLVVMVTHNPELAEQYSTRIVRLRDGKITDDSNPFTVPEPKPEEEKKKPTTFGKSKMNFLTSLSLSFNNLRTKKARTIITAAAGSIGIIGIALILALSTGVNDYTVNLQKEAMEDYPITIEGTTYDYEEFINRDFDAYEEEEETADIEGKVVATVSETKDQDMYMPVEKKNNLGALKKYFEDPANNVNEYVGTGSVVYEYNAPFFAYAKNSKGEFINTSAYISSVDTSAMYTMYSGNNLKELPMGRDKDTVSKKTKKGYEVLYGDFPEKDDEVVLITDSGGTLDASVLTQIGMITHDEYKELVEKPELATSGKKAAFSYEDFCKRELTILPSAFRYVKNSDGLYEYIDDDDERIGSLLDKYGFKVRIVGVLMPVQDNSSLSMSFSYDTNTQPLAYNYKLTNKIIDRSAESDVVKAQLSDEAKSVITGVPFEAEDKEKAAAIRKYIVSKGESDETEGIINALSMMSGEMSIGTKKETDKNQSVEEILSTVDDKELVEMFDMYFYGMNFTNHNDALSAVGYASYDLPSAITIYPDTFEGKQNIMELLQKYNETASDEDHITYYDFIESITEGITQMIMGISLVLIAFVSISLVVSCIMIGIITHISVLERTKEIGILRALGASKANISQVFNAETFIIGMLAGILGVVCAEILCIPMNIIISGMLETGQLTANVPILPGLLLIAISTVITMIGGIIPAHAASRKDPVIALRTE